jgi:hypothetical protein
MKRAALLLPLLLLLTFTPAHAKKKVGDLKKADAKLRKLVGEAIDRGAGWLRKQQREDGSFPSLYDQSYPMGGTALAILALLHSGEKPTSEVTGKAFALLRSRYAQQKDGRLRTYSIGVTVMALVEYGRRLGATKGGFFLERKDLEWLREMTRWLISTQKPSGAWHYPHGGNYDHSNTQYALLALKEARRAGVRVEPRVFAKALTHMLSAQEKNGPRVPRYREHGGDGVYARDRKRVPGSDRVRGWGYVDGMLPSGSMTAAGVAVVAICRGELTGKEYESLLERATPAERDGLAWLGHNFSVRHNPRMGAAWHYYYLYGLERAGVLAGVVYMGKHRWYAEGAKYLVDCQKPDGSWRTLQGVPPPGMPKIPVADPCFALLFLARATARSIGVVTERNLLNLTEAHRLSDADLANVFIVAFKELDGMSGEMLEDRASDFAFCGPRIIPMLIKKLIDDDEAARARGFLVLKKITGKSHGYDPKAKAEAREAAMDRWTEWFLVNRKKLAIDRPAKLIR